MPKFVAKCDSFGYLGTYWKKGDVLEADSVPNEHFAPFGYHEAKSSAEKKDSLVNKAAAEAVEKVVKVRRKKS